MARLVQAMTIIRQRIPPGERVLDLGCGAGRTTARLTLHYETHAIDISPLNVYRTRNRAPDAHVKCAPAGRLPYPDAHFAAVLLLDVFEHVRSERAVLHEVSRVLRPGGLLILSVPHSGWLRWADSLNIYAWLTGEDPLSPPHTSCASFIYHRHYSLNDLKRRLAARFMIDYVRCSGIGLPEFINLGALLLGKRLLRSSALYMRLVRLYYLAYWFDDKLTLQRGGYNLLLAGHRCIANQENQVEQRRSQRLEDAVFSASTGQSARSPHSFHEPS